MSTDPRVTAAAAEAAKVWGAGATGSRLVSGSTTLHRELERSLRDFAGGEDALVFSSGYTANLGAITALGGPDSLLVSDADNHASIIDEAHSLGVVGSDGTGAARAAGIAGQPDVVLTVTLSKSLGAQGGAVLGDGAVVEQLVNTARTFIFDTGLAPAAVGAALAALRVLIDQPQLAAAVLARAGELARICDVTEEPTSAVVSVILGDPEVSVAAAAACLQRGVRVGCFRPPTVPAGTSRLRLTARAALTDDEIALAAKVLTEVLGLPR
jgi:7-keto-8-aminopelargonate synthetase-like enzyme